MVGVDELIRARAEFERGEWASALDRWRGVDPGSLRGDDLTSAAEAAELLGRPRESLDLYRRAYEERMAAGDVEGAARCTFHLAMICATTGDTSASAAWVGRGDRLLGSLPDGSVEVGYLSFARMFGHLRAGRFEEAAACAAEATDRGRAHGDHALVAMGLGSQGRLAIYGGRVPPGLALLDESMLEVGSGAVAPVTLGHVYCTAIEGGQEVSDVDRVAEWTGLLQEWCESHPDLVVFTGQCSLHRSQILRARGAWPQALDELDAAIERYERSGAVDAVGQAAYERGDLHRLLGDLDAADRSFALSAERGVDPQPGLAELWLERGDATAAVAAVRRVLAESAGVVARARILPGVTRVLAATGDAEGARRAAEELELVADGFGCDPLRAEAALSSGIAHHVAGDPLGALPYLRKARQLAGRSDLPYLAARARAVSGLALRDAGDPESAAHELSAARDALSALGAVADLRRLDGGDGGPERPGGLTEREVEVLRLVAAGHANARIAAELVLSERTVARHLSNIFTKLDVGSRTAAAAYAFEHGLVER
jgi:DNA-binding CsgD family transcriptional regulator/tetratricopeptide (TPR) repeat protein